MPYAIDFTYAAREHLDYLTAGQKSLLWDAVQEQLVHQPGVQTRNRKPLGPNTLARWELRVQSLRVLYNIEEDPEPIVVIKAVGVKVRNRLRVGDSWLEWS